MNNTYVILIGTEATVNAGELKSALSGIGRVTEYDGNYFLVTNQDENAIWSAVQRFFTGGAGTEHPVILRVTSANASMLPGALRGFLGNASAAA